MALRNFFVLSVFVLSSGAGGVYPVIYCCLGSDWDVSCSLGGEAPALLCLQSCWIPMSNSHLLEQSVAWQPPLALSAEMRLWICLWDINALSVKDLCLWEIRAWIWMVLRSWDAWKWGHSLRCLTWGSACFILCMDNVVQDEGEKGSLLLSIRDPLQKEIQSLYSSSFMWGGCCCRFVVLLFQSLVFHQSKVVLKKMTS